MNTRNIKSEKARDWNFLLSDTPGAFSASAKHQGHYWSFPLPHSPFKAWLSPVEKKWNLKLNSRGETHLTLISPPEWEILRLHMSVKQVAEAFKSLDPRVWRIRCLARYQKDPALQTIYWVLEAPDVLQARNQIAKSLPPQVATTFRTQYFPHITLGFTLRDLHLQDGAIKDTRHCQAQGPHDLD